ncbi:hypothetical protein C9J48_20670 [Photobacterium profundum]|uniref:Uncharacterized protein n=1 Tax=Photobacterium profundum 3TCK TaxID=314280 RepID=Q1Z8U9_9GAMM|nr:hypothetical protein [Photobacterium profundum]EAS45009.1 hypothetical protein P3TCK_21035 [Photobacterium profundum 3TCK]PSV60086.1 hypothetical protein C9J48_20670 [Photobacterium profundum]
MSGQIKQVAEKLIPHMEMLNAHFEESNSRFNSLMGKGHDDLGRVLKCHLIIEYYLNLYLSHQYGISDIDQIRLSFAQKVNLLPKQGNAVVYVKKGIERINKIRNRFGHKLDASICEGELNEIDDVLKVMRPETKDLSPIERIENFTATACTFLIVQPKEIEEIYADAFNLFLAEKTNNNAG